MAKNIAVFIGSASSTSFSRVAVEYLKKIAPASIELNIVQIDDLPLYNRDLDENSPASYERVRAAVAAADGVLWVSPEHNGALSASLKNVIDVVSRPMDQSKWVGKPLGIVTVAAGMAAGVRVADQLRVIASGPFINMPVYSQNASVGGLFSGVFNEQGDVTIEPVKVMLQSFIDGYAEFVTKF
ncbi:NAD(P)H-dependent oxidoreductase [Kingella negevensis]|uniref:NADPH-dependent FMN reductase n=1 Tax=Kingella negevensis TaxID=1522312 RepID=UPI002542AC33|nr:NADPH-dependent FMN reductase [Kingella negevensis]WII93804.1 NAD(P)H-dependent oxidoreductase [Kingella negevensis]